MKWELNKSWRIGLAGLWLLLTFSLSAWWMIHGMSQSANMQEFTQDLVEKIAFAFGHRLEEMDLQIQFQPTDLDVDKAMPMSLILNELLTNSFKYAFGETARPGLKISLVQQGEKLLFQYADNGPGLPENAGGTGSFGSKLMTSLSGQLGGQARQWSEGGARFELVF